MITIEDGLKLLHPLIGKPVWNIRQSHGSCFLAEFGRLRRTRVLPERRLGEGSDARIVPERKVDQGEWSLLVEQCHWRITLGAASISDTKTGPEGMRQIMAQLETAEVAHIVLDADGLGIRFSNSATMILGPSAPVDAAHPGDQWSLFLPDGSTLARDTGGNLYRS